MKMNDERVKRGRGRRRARWPAGSRLTVACADLVLLDPTVPAGPGRLGLDVRLRPFSRASAVTVDRAVAVGAERKKQAREASEARVERHEESERRWDRQVATHPDVGAVDGAPDRVDRDVVGLARVPLLGREDVRDARGRRALARVGALPVGKTPARVAGESEVHAERARVVILESRSEARRQDRQAVSLAPSERAGSDEELTYTQEKAT